jgi:thiol-disulfide isomerase/thioredoxin
MKKALKILIISSLAIFLGINLVVDLREKPDDISVQNTNIPIGISKGEQAPNFEGLTLEGEKFKLSDLRGKTVLINVFATWCGPCQIEAPHLAKVYNEIGGDEVIFIGLNLEENPGAISAFKEEFMWEFPLILNQDGRLTEIYQPIGLPTSWFIDSDGIIQYVHAGPITAEMLSQTMTDIQEGRDPNPFASLE